MRGTGLIDWASALAHTHWAVSDPGAVEAALTAAVACAPCFRNRDFPLSPVPLLVRDEWAADVRPRLEAYVRLLGRVVSLYREHAEVRGWYGLGSDAERLIAADRGLGDAPWVCRLDGYLVHGTGDLRILENNADAPAGTLFTPRINTLLRRVVDAGLVRAWPTTALTFTGAGRFLDALLSAAEAAGAAPPTSIAILQLRDAPNRESREMVTEFSAAGYDAYLADPRELRIVRGEARFGRRPVDLCWNKLNTIGWLRLGLDAEILRCWERALRDHRFVHVNPFGARYVAESKLTLGFIQEPRFASLLTVAERDLVQTLLPWSRKATANGTTACAELPTLAEALLENQSEYVIKEPYDIRGEGVTIGYDCTWAQWRTTVSDALARGYLAQRRVRPTQYPVVTPGSPDVAWQNISLDTYVLGGRVAGFASKASRHAKVNVFQGGQQLAVHVVRDRSTLNPDPPHATWRDPADSAAAQ